MSTAITLMGRGIDDDVADTFFQQVSQLEGILSNFREQSDLSRLARGEVDLDHVDPAVAVVLEECMALRRLTRGDFEHEPRRRHGGIDVSMVDVNALAKGWIIEDAAIVLRLLASEFLVNAGGDVIAGARPNGACWRIGIQHPHDRSAILGTMEVAHGAVATSGTYERGDHIRTNGARRLVSVTVVGPDLGQADALSTAVFASGESPPAWWRDVHPGYGLLTMTDDGRLRWFPPSAGANVIFRPGVVGALALGAN